jgi:hypothetical protein
VGTQLLCSRVFRFNAGCAPQTFWETDVDYEETKKSKIVVAPDQAANSESAGLGILANQKSEILAFLGSDDPGQAQVEKKKMKESKS